MYMCVYAVLWFCFKPGLEELAAVNKLWPVQCSAVHVHVSLYVHVHVDIIILSDKLTFPEL